MAVYFAALLPDRTGAWVIFLPDFPEAVSQGNDLEDALAAGQTLLNATAEAFARDGRALPQASDPDAVMRFGLKEMAALPEEYAQGRPVVAPFATPKADLAPVRVSLRMTRGDLAEIDRKAKLAGCTRSAFMVRAARAFSETYS
ncbi:MAG: type II toxin-antitoxin system HicB family antitoxin [Desulfovibrionaceae bacterium]|nr:type II toxin-antitoxin system HicB family antitoxin [Desulfovibrionaceae bacterium]